MKVFEEKTSPFLHNSETGINLQLDLLAGLLAVIIIAVVQNGLRALAITCFTAFIYWTADTICNIILKAGNENFVRAVTTGLIIALICPVTVPLWVPAVSAFATVVFTRIILGKTYKRLFINSAIAWLIMLTIAPSQMTVFPAVRGFDVFPVFEGVESFQSTFSIAQSLQSGRTPPYTVLNLFTGHYPGGIGTTCIFIILAVCVYFIFRKNMAWQVSLSMILTVTVFALIFNRTTSSVLYSVLYELTATSYIFVAVFVAGDIINAPMLTLSKILYGVLIGTMTMLFRYLGLAEHCVVLALIICNLLAELLDLFSLKYELRYTKRKVFKL